MGHATGKDLYRNLGRKIDNLSARAPWNDKLYKILSELYTPEEAQVAVGMPYALSDLDRIARITRRDRAGLRVILDGLCQKGLVLDLHHDDRCFYQLNPFVIGIFEFTMMRLGSEAKPKQWAELFYAYLVENQEFWSANLKDDPIAVPIRALPHESLLNPAAFTEILDYEKASVIIDACDRFAIGYCSCRHMKQHKGLQKCTTPLETCSTFGAAADYMIRNNLAREVSKSQMRENLARAKELGLVVCADNVQKKVTFLCCCCKCCCEALLGISERGYPRAVMTSSFIAVCDREQCAGCAKCVKACPIRAIKMVPAEKPREGKKKEPQIDAAFCLGCGVCGLGCESGALRLHPRARRVLHPESTFERILLQSLDNGTLQNQIFDNPESRTQDWMRGLLGGFLRLSPVKKGLMSDALRSTFLASMKKGLVLKGQGWILEL